MTRPSKYDLKGYAGDTYRLEVRLRVKGTGEPIALDPAGWTAQIRRTAAATNPKAEFQIDTTDAATGVLVLELTAAQTAGLPAVGVWDLQQSITDVTRTYLSGAAYFPRDVTR